MSGLVNHQKFENRLNLLMRTFTALETIKI